MEFNEIACTIKKSNTNGLEAKKSQGLALNWALNF